MVVDGEEWQSRQAEEVEATLRKVRQAYLSTLREAVALAMALRRIDADKVFSFANYEQARTRARRLQEQLAEELEVIIADGVAASWALGNAEADVLCVSVFGQDAVDAMPEALRRVFFSHNEEAREAFAARRVDGLTLSGRVWRLVRQYTEEIELGIDAALGEGLSADQLSRRLRGYLNEPERLFRRVRDKYGNLQLSKAAAAYHPGRGVYRSSYKNARRMAATEINISYRTADYLRWQKLPFVVGIRVNLSNNHTLNGEPFFDICDELSAPRGSTNTSGRGCYPKDFRFTGWHPLCRCYVTTILKTEEELREDTARIMRGEVPTGESVNEIKDVPEQFTQWVDDHAEQVKRWKSLPYFMRDNERYIPELEVTTTARRSADRSQAEDAEIMRKAGL